MTAPLLLFLINAAPALVQDARAPVSSAAWQGWRKFRVARRQFEDAARSQCSFHLEPVDGAPLPPFKPALSSTYFHDDVPPAGSTGIPGTPVEVRFARSGRILAWDPQDDSLLAFAKRNGVEVDSGCRVGNCGSCETRLVSGSVHYAQAPDHAISPGYCLLCVGTPASALVLEA